MPDDVVTMDKIVALCKRRGFIFQSSEIYGGLASTYDYGHYGVLLKTNVKNEWWRSVLQERDDMVALDAAILMHPEGLGGVGPPRRASPTRSSQCLGECKRRFREDHLREAQPGGRAAKLPGVRRRADRAAQVQPDVRDPHGPGRRTRARRLPAPRDRPGHLRQLQERPAVRRARSRRSASRRSASRSATRSRRGNFIFRTREFEQMEIEFFCHPAEAPAVVRVLDATSACSGTWTSASGADHLRLREHDADELTHYSSAHGRHRVPVPDGLVRARGHRQPRRLRPHPAPEVLRREARVLRPARPASATCRT